MLMLKVERLRNKVEVEVAQNLSFYVHIPYCIKRCGYCDFNTYTPSELQSDNFSKVTSEYIEALLVEVDRSASIHGGANISSIFFGGGTPSLMPSSDLLAIIRRIKERFTVNEDCEITLEANPDSLSDEFLHSLREAGASRISLGMQSAVPHVLEVLDRTHDRGNVALAAERIRKHGYKHLSVDLIYGAPGESLDDWAYTIDQALELPIDHLSAYALIVEKGTKLSHQINRGQLVMPDEDETADKYLLLDQALTAKGMSWYELSNWAKPGGECKHNIAYWDGSFWWGLGAGAHSFIGAKRWWNVKHPMKYQSLLRQAESPVAGEEFLTEDNRRVESMMLRIRMRQGISLNELNEHELLNLEPYREGNFFESKMWDSGLMVLTLQGRLIADRIVRDLLG
jgi:oxygen-independent coproporphyrinogen-3 oxidase